MIEALKNKKIGVIMGGLSEERDVSLASGGAVLAALRDAGYDACAIYFEGPGLVEEIRGAAPGVVFIALHGRYGEDGAVQGLLEVMGIPYTGSGVTGSAMAMDKAVTKKLLRFHGIPTADFITVKRGAFDMDDPGLVRIGLPLVVKPSTEGSTIGMSFVYDMADLPDAVALAFRHDREIVIEKYIAGREITAGILAGSPLPLVEIVAPGGVYDYQAKYQSHDTRYICPALLDGAATERIQGLAARVFGALDGYGVGRVDFRLDGGGEPYVLEMNTIPGMTGTSLLPKAAAAAGMDFTTLVETILVGALKRHEG